MSHHSQSSTKRRALESSGTLNPRAEEVSHPLFVESDFFDPHDLVQLKYEAMRALAEDGYTMAKAAREYGISRPTLYQAQSAFEQGGVAGLLPAKPGPKQPHKLTEKVRDSLEALRKRQPDLKAEELARRLSHRHKISVHPRTVEKVLQAERAKRGRHSRRRNRR